MSETRPWRSRALLLVGSIFPLGFGGYIKNESQKTDLNGRFELPLHPGNYLSGEQLQTVAGGTWDSGCQNIFVSVVSFGALCAGLAVNSAILGSVDQCQPSKQ
jgi:hypothetical protein